MDENNKYVSPECQEIEFRSMGLIMTSGTIPDSPWDVE